MSLRQEDICVNIFQECLRVFCTKDSVSYSDRIKAKEQLSICLFFNTNQPEERVQVLLTEKELSKLPDDSPNIFKKLNIDR